MVEAADVADYTDSKQDLQLIVETLFREQLDLFDLRAFLADPRGYTRAFLEVGIAQAVRAVAVDAFKLGEGLGEKAGG